MKSPFPERTAELTVLYEKKQKDLLSNFLNKEPQKIYEKIIELGKSLPRATENIQKDCFLVEGCQSLAYLSSSMTPEGLMNYSIHSDALISLGLASLLFFIYQNEKAELILLYPPLFIQELGLQTSLSYGRSNGLASMYTRMKKDALHLFIKKGIDL